MSDAPKLKRKAATRPPVPPRRTVAVTSQAQRQAAAILEVLAGVRRPVEAAQVLATSLPRYYQLERRALLGLLAACEPAPRGPRSDASKRVTALERENRRLRRECDRQQALVRATERSLGLALPPPKPAPASKSHDSGKRKRRQARPAVRALKALQLLPTLVTAEAAEAALSREQPAPQVTEA